MKSDDIYNLKAAVSRLRKGILELWKYLQRYISHFLTEKARGTEGGQGASSPLGDEQSKNNFRCSLFLKEVYLCFFRNFASPSDFQSAETPVQQQTCKIRLNRSLHIHVLAGFWSHD